MDLKKKNKDQLLFYINELESINEILSEKIDSFEPEIKQLEFLNNEIERLKQENFSNMQKMLRLKQTIEITYKSQVNFRQDVLEAVSDLLGLVAKHEV